MTRFTFQFIARPGEDGSIEVRESSDEVACVERVNGSLTEVYLKDGSSIEVLPNGDLRYSINTKNHDDVDLEKVFEQGLATVRKIVAGSKNEYSVSLLVNNTDPVGTYLNISDKITKLGKKEFNNDDPSYSELNDNTVKISFRDERKGVLI